MTKCKWTNVDVVGFIINRRKITMLIQNLFFDIIFNYQVIRMHQWISPRYHCIYTLITHDHLMMFGEVTLDRWCGTGGMDCRASSSCHRLGNALFCRVKEN